ncbi:MAG: M15 family metallopeptidase [Clostridiales bacterium]|nr:M15 family metallopeptidase [Clostridiales bacterium]
MNQKQKTSMAIKIGFFVVFFIIIAFLILLITTLLTPSKDITNFEPSREPNGTLASSEPAVQPTSEPDGTWKSYSYDFAADLSDYEKYMNPKGDEYLTLINADNRLNENYVPSDLTDVINTRQDGQRNTQQLREYAAKALEALFIEAEKAGMTYVNSSSGYGLSVMSAYRSYSYQQTLFADKVKQYSSYGDDAEKMAATEVQYPGASEHQSGLCCDMHNIRSADTAFASQEAATWLKNNCYKFGFILRYPEDKTDITGISFEPWHFRYVGRYHATRMNELGFCLEEYIEYLKK